MITITNPLPEGHPATTGNETCPICHQHFRHGERVALLAPEVEIPQNVIAVLMHAQCVLHGVVTEHGIIQHVKDGNGSPFPIVTDKGQFKVAEFKDFR